MKLVYETRPFLMFKRKIVKYKSNGL